MPHLGGSRSPSPARTRRPPPPEPSGNGAGPRRARTGQRNQDLPATGKVLLPDGAALQRPAGVRWPVRTGAVPPLAEAFSGRPETVSGIEALLAPGAVVTLVPGREDTGNAGGWAGSCGKTQLAAYLAEALWQADSVEVLAWVNASSRASVLSGYAETAARTGLDHSGGAESVAARLLAWLGGTGRRWLVVLDDVRDPADVDGLLPAGPAGRVLVTAAAGGAVPGGRLAAVPAFSQHEAMGCLLALLRDGRHQRSGAYDLAQDLRGDPAALAQAGAVIAGSDVSCRDYQHHFTRQKQRLRAADGTEPRAAAVTWTLSAEYAGELLPGGGTWPLLVLTALLDSHGIPRALLTAPAVCRYLAGPGGAASRPDPQHAHAALQALERAGLVSAGPGGPSVWVSAPLQAAVRAAATAEQLDRAARAAADAVLQAWPGEQPWSWLSAQMRACAASLLRHAGDALWAGGRCHGLLPAAGQSMTSARLAGPAAAWWQDVTAGCERLLAPGHPDTLRAAGQLADALLSAGHVADAVQRSQWVLERRESALGPGHPASAAARSSLGRALAAAGRTDEAAAVLLEASGHTALPDGRLAPPLPARPQ